MKLVKKLLLAAFALPLLNAQGMEPDSVDIDSSTIALFKTNDKQNVAIEFKYIAHQSKTLVNQIKAAGTLNEATEIPCSKETFIILQAALQEAYIHNCINDEFFESLTSLNPEQLINIANAASWADFQSLIKTVIEIIGQRCLKHESYLPHEILESYHSLGLNDVLTELIRNLLDKKTSQNEPAENEAQVTLVANDGKEFKILKSIASHFKTIQHIMGDYDNETEAIPLPNVASETLQTLISIAKNINQENPEPISIMEGLIPQDTQKIIDLFTAADYLGSEYICNGLISIIEKKLNDSELLNDYDKIAWLLQNSTPSLIQKLDLTTFFTSLIPDQITATTLTGHSYFIASVAFSPNNKLLATGSDQTIKIWDVVDGSCIKTLKGRNLIDLIAFSPNGQILATGSTWKKIVQLWNVVSGSCLHTLTVHDDSDLSCFAFSPDGTLLATDSDDNIKLWNVIDGSSLFTLTDVCLHISCLAFSPDGNLLVTSSDKKIKLWNVVDGSCINTLKGHKKDIKNLAFSPNGKILASISRDKVIKLWDATSFDCLHTLVSPPTNNNTQRYICRDHIVFSPDGNLLATVVAGDSMLNIWDVHKGSHLYTLTGHTHLISGLTFSHNGNKIITASWDKTVKLWDIKTGVCLKTLTEHTQEVRCLTLSPNGHLLATGSKDNTIKLWRLFDEELLNLSCEQLLLLKFYYEAHKHTIPFECSDQPYLKELHDSYPSSIRIWINKLTKK